jgi:hypothetical protein
MSDGVNRLYGYNIVVPSTHLVNILLANNDPRLEEWIDPMRERRSFRTSTRISIRSNWRTNELF